MPSQKRISTAGTMGFFSSIPAATNTLPYPTQASAAAAQYHSRWDIPGAGQKAGQRGGVLRPQHDQKARRGTHDENGYGGYQAGDVLAEQQHPARRRYEKPKVQGLVEHLAAKQVDEDTEAAEENRQPQVEVLEDARVDHAVFGKIDDRSTPLCAAGDRRRSSCGPRRPHRSTSGSAAAPPASHRCGCSRWCCGRLQGFAGAVDDVLQRITLADRRQHGGRRDVVGVLRAGELDLQRVDEEHECGEEAPAGKPRRCGG